MYEAFYGLTEEPFRLSPDSKFCFRHSSYKKAKAYMQYALHRGEGFVMVTGRPGTGKSTLINDLTSELAVNKATYVSLACTQIAADDLLRLVVLKFGLDGRLASKALLIHDLDRHLRRLHSEGRHPLLIIDEAQDLEATALEELRLLTNLQQNNQPLLQIFLVGQAELRAKVRSRDLEQFHQRIVAACHIDPLSESETEEYIRHRLKHVGWKEDPMLDPALFPPIHKRSQGIARLINLICGRLLLHGMVEELHHLGPKDIEIVLESLVDEHLLPDSTDFDPENGNAKPVLVHTGHPID